MHPASNFEKKIDIMYARFKNIFSIRPFYAWFATGSQMAYSCFDTLIHYFTVLAPSNSRGHDSNTIFSSLRSKVSSLKMQKRIIFSNLCWAAINQKRLLVAQLRLLKKLSFMYTYITLCQEDLKWNCKILSIYCNL